MIDCNETILNAPPLKVVIAEDDALQQIYLCSLVQALGYEVIPANDGQEALDKIVETGAEILISDLQMPKLNGLELTQAIRARNLDTYVHIFMITGSDETKLRNEALAVGVDDFLPKSGSPAMLKARIHTAARLISHSRELAKRSRIIKEANDHIQDDLRAAAAAQRQLLPDTNSNILGFGISSTFVPSAIVSGDMLSCFALNDEMLAFYAVDVSGHGVHAALLSVAIGHLITPEFFSDRVIDQPGAPNPAALVADLNSRFCVADDDAYFTMFCGVINMRTGVMDYCQAGYPSPFYVTHNGVAEAVGQGGFPVGMLASASYENASHSLAYGSSLIISSDAASEATNPEKQFFGTERVRQIAEAIPTVGIKNIPELMVKTLNEWRDGVPLEDDLTVLALNRKIPHDIHYTL